jgi:hypothetical protein
VTPESIPSDHRPRRGSGSLDRSDHRRDYRLIWGEDPPAPARLPRDGRGDDARPSWPSEPRELGEGLKSRLHGLYRALNGLGRERRTGPREIIQEVLVQIDRLDELLTELQEELRRKTPGP